MTLTEFWASKDKLAIWCDTEDKAKRLCEAFDRMGKKWASGTRYVEWRVWGDSGSQSCYSNRRQYSDKSWYKQAGYTIIPFDDIDDFHTTTSDQSIKHDAGKPQLTLVPTAAITAMARVLEYGANKYTRDGWRSVDKQRYKDALYRHWLAYLDEPEGMDAESGLPHIWHVAANVAILIGLEGKTNENNTRKI